MNDIPQDIQELDERIKKFKISSKQKSSKPTEKKFVYAYQIGSRIATELVSGVLVGAGVGYFLDKLAETTPILLIIFLILGSAAGFLNVYRYVKQEDMKKE